MGFFQDLFKGDFSQVGHDITQGLKDPLTDIALASAVALPFLAPEIGAGLGALDTAVTSTGASLLGDLGIGGASAATGALDLGTIGAGTTAAGGALTDAAALPATATLDSLVSGTGGYALPGTAAAPLNLVSDASGGLDLGTIGAGTDASGNAIAAGAPLNLSQVGTNAGINAGTAAGSSGGVLSSITSALSPVTGALKTAAPVIGLAGLGANLYTGYEQKQQLNQLNQQEQANAANEKQIAQQAQAAAQPLLSSGQTLTTYLQTGTLPQAFQAQVDQQIAAAKASVVQGYAARGQNTNPQQNSALAQDLANVDLQAQSLKANLESTLASAGNQMVQTANTLLASGINATNLASEIPIQVSQLNAQLNAQMSTAVSNFAAALNGSVPNKNAITLNLPNNVVNSSGGLNLNA